MANHLDTAVWVVTIESEEDFMVRENIAALLDSNTLWCPCALHNVVVL
jgi:hypothetical protein